MIITDLKQLEISDSQDKPKPPPDPFKKELPMSPVITAFKNGENKVYNVIFNNNFDSDTSSVLALVDVLNNAKEGSSVNIYINSQGGSVHTLTMILAAIYNTKAKVTTIAEGLAASCGAMLWAYGHNVQISPNSVIMFHAPSHMDWDKSLNVRDRAEGILERFKALMEPILKRRLITEEQYMQMFDEKKDVYITAETYRSQEGDI